MRRSESQMNMVHTPPSGGKNEVRNEFILNSMKF